MSVLTDQPPGRRLQYTLIDPNWYIHIYYSTIWYLCIHETTHRNRNVLIGWFQNEHYYESPLTCPARISWLWFCYPTSNPSSFTVYRLMTEVSYSREMRFTVSTMCFCCEAFSRIAEFIFGRGMRGVPCCWSLGWFHSTLLDVNCLPVSDWILHFSTGVRPTTVTSWWLETMEPQQRKVVWLWYNGVLYFVKLFSSKQTTFSYLSYLLSKHSATMLVGFKSLRLLHHIDDS